MSTDETEPTLGGPSTAPSGGSGQAKAGPDDSDGDQRFDRLLDMIRKQNETILTLLQAANEGTAAAVSVAATLRTLIDSVAMLKGVLSRHIDSRFEHGQGMTEGGEEEDAG